MPERNTAARAVTENTKPSTKYTYDYNYLPPLAMVGALSPAEAFPPVPIGYHLVARSALKILINSIMIGVKNKGDNIEFVQRCSKILTRSLSCLDGDTERDLSNAIAMELEKQGSPTTLPELKVFLEGVIESFAKTLTLRLCSTSRKALGSLQLSPVQLPASKITTNCSNSFHCRRSARIFKRMRSLPPCGWLGRIR